MLNPDMKLQSIEAVKRSVMNNLGIAYVPQFSVEEELKNGSLLRLETELDGKPYPGVIVFHKNRCITPQMELAFRILQEQIEADYGEYINNKG
ncbi:MAG: LysR substrate-binding domain-containing protein [Clostridiales bacterium]|nr:LysR substrate-binding domain-containing protein [Clostridiales bacterium]